MNHYRRLVLINFVLLGLAPISARGDSNSSCIQNIRTGLGLNELDKAVLCRGDSNPLDATRCVTRLKDYFFTRTFGRGLSFTARDLAYACSDGNTFTAAKECIEYLGRQKDLKGMTPWGLGTVCGGGNTGPFAEKCMNALHDRFSKSKTMEYTWPMVTDACGGKRNDLENEAEAIKKTASCFEKAYYFEKKPMPRSLACYGGTENPEPCLKKIESYLSVKAGTDSVDSTVMGDAVIFLACGNGNSPELIESCMNPNRFIASFSKFTLAEQMAIKGISCGQSVSQKVIRIQEPNPTKPPYDHDHLYTDPPPEPHYRFRAIPVD